MGLDIEYLSNARLLRVKCMLIPCILERGDSSSILFNNYRLFFGNACALLQKTPHTYSCWICTSSPTPAFIKESSVHAKSKLVSTWQGNGMSNSWKSKVREMLIVCALGFRSFVMAWCRAVETRLSLVILQRLLTGGIWCSSSAFFTPSLLWIAC